MGAVDQPHRAREQRVLRGCDHGLRIGSWSVGLAEDFSRVVESLPPDWTDLTLDLRIFDEQRYVEAATVLVQVNAQPYSQHDWHWRLIVAHEFGHAAAAETMLGTLGLLDELGIDGELAV